MENNDNMEIGNPNENDNENENKEDLEENGEEEYKVAGEEEGGENYEQENNDGEEEGEGEGEGEEEHFDEEESQNEVHTDDQNNAHYNIEEYLPYEHKHDQYSCSCCEHYYTDSIKNNSDLPTARCEVCGNEINQRSLNFYKNKNRSSKIKEKK